MLEKKFLGIKQFQAHFLIKVFLIKTKCVIVRAGSNNFGELVENLRNISGKFGNCMKNIETFSSTFAGDL